MCNVSTFWVMWNCRSWGNAELWMLLSRMLSRRRRGCKMNVDERLVWVPPVQGGVCAKFFFSFLEYLYVCGVRALRHVYFPYFFFFLLYSSSFHLLRKYIFKINSTHLHIRENLSLMYKLRFAVRWMCAVECDIWILHARWGWRVLDWINIKKNFF